MYLRSRRFKEKKAKEFFNSLPKELQEEVLEFACHLTADPELPDEYYDLVGVRGWTYEMAGHLCMFRNEIDLILKENLSEQRGDDFDMGRRRLAECFAFLGYDYAADREDDYS